MHELKSRADARGTTWTPDRRAVTPARDDVSRSRRLALGAALGPALFTAAWLVLGFVSPGYTLFGVRIAPYSVVSQPISGLGLGVTAAYMNAAFVLGAGLLFAGVIGIVRGVDAMSLRSRVLCAGLLLLSPVGMGMDGVFTLESMRLHLVGFLLAAGAPVVALPVAGFAFRRDPHWRRFTRWLIAAGPITLVLIVLFFVSFDPSAAGAGRGIGGVTQRLLVLEMHAWFAAMGIYAWRRRPVASR